MLKNPLDQFIVDLIVKRKYQIQSDVLANKNVIINYYKKGFSLQILHQYLMDNKKLKKCSFKEFADVVFAEIPSIKEFLNSSKQQKEAAEKEKEENREHELFFCLKKK